jgi:hypothetical protein
MIVHYQVGNTKRKKEGERERIRFYVNTYMSLFFSRQSSSSSSQEFCVSSNLCLYDEE